MEKILMPLASFIFGLLIIFFRKKVGKYITKAYEKFPKYENGVKAFNISFSVRPVYVAIMGVIICVVSLLGLIASLAE